MTKPTPTPRRVIIESPYAGDTSANTDYARACLAHSLALGEAPLASHLLYTQPGVLDDNLTAERAQGIAANLAWITLAEALVVYTDLGISHGMRAAITHATASAVPIELRYLEEFS
tara:strand:- start:32990 stop:33337 length:348 start_codon:yes stop_codon:yes gene_type:complete